MPMALAAVPAIFAAVAPETAASIFGASALTAAAGDGLLSAGEATYAALPEFAAGESIATAGGAAASTTLGSVFSSAGAASSLLQGASGVEQILGAEQQNKVNKQSTAQNLAYEQAQDQTALTEQKVNLERTMGTEQAQFGAAGVDVNQGSPQQVMQFSQGQGLLSQALQKYSSIQRENQIKLTGYKQQNEDMTQLSKGFGSLLTAGTAASNKGIFGNGGLFPSIVGSTS